MTADTTTRLAVTAFLIDRLTALRKEELTPLAQKELTPGERRSVKLGGRLAAWVSLPKPSRRASVTSERELLKWARVHVPQHIETVTEVAVSDQLIDWLAEHAPQFLRTAERVDPQWTEDMLTSMKNRGFIADGNGEKVTEIPGVSAGVGEPSPRVNLEADAADVIAAAWRAGDIDVSGLLALPAGES